MWESITFTLSIIIGVFSFLLTWKVYHHFWSLADVVHESNFSYFLKRFTVSSIFGILGLVIAMSYFDPNSEISESSNKNSSGSEIKSKPSSNENRHSSTGTQNSTDDSYFDITKSIKNTFSPSFDCSKTNLEADIAVCNNQLLSEIDLKNAELYKIAASKNLQVAQAIRNATYKKKIECGSDINCIRDVYGHSLARYIEIIEN